MRAVIVVIGTGRNQLHRIDAEYHHVLHVLLEHRRCPGIVGVHLGAISNLVAADAVLRGRRHADCIGEFHSLAFHQQASEQVSHAEQRAALVVAHHQHGPVDRLHAKPLLAFRRRRQPVEAPTRDRAQRGGLSDRDNRPCIRRPLGRNRPTDLSALLDLVHQHGHGLFFGGGKAVRSQDHGFLEVKNSSRGGAECQASGEKERCFDMVHGDFSWAISERYTRVAVRVSGNVICHAEVACMERGVR